MRITLCLLAALAAPLSAQQGDKDHADHAVAHGGSFPAGWTVRPDGKGEIKNVKLVPMEPGMHLTLGPAVILYREDSGGTEPFHTLATFTQTRKSEHPEGYGLFFGGRALEGSEQKYTYFLVRQDGSYLIKRRDGEKTSEVSKGWVKHPAVKQPDAKGVATNLLEIDNKRDPSKVTFMVNGQGVHTADAKTMDPGGSVGIRANHNLDLHIQGFDVHR